MEKKELEFAIEILAENVNYYSREMEKAKRKNLPMIEQSYFSRILGIAEALSYLGYSVDGFGRSVDCKDIESVEYMHYKIIER